MPLKRDSKCTRAQTMTSQHTVNQALRLPDSLTRCQAIILANTDRVDVGHHVLFRLSTMPETTPHVGRVEEILADTESGRICGVLVRDCVVGLPVLPYRMPSCRIADATFHFVIFEVRLSDRHVMCTRKLTQNALGTPGEREHAAQLCQARMQVYEDQSCVSGTLYNRPASRRDYSPGRSE